MKCHAVSSGSYSDYSVSAIFERYEDALAYAAARNGCTLDDMEYIEEVEGSGSPDYWTRIREDRYRLLTAGRNTYGVEEFDYYPAGVVPALTDESSG